MEGALERGPVRRRPQMEVRSEGQPERRAAGLPPQRQLLLLEPHVGRAGKEPPQLGRPSAGVQGGEGFLEPPGAYVVKPALAGHPSHRTLPTWPETAHAP